jgi:predicted phage tail protein
VEFYLDGALASTDTTSPYGWSWNTATATNTAHTLSSKAYDAAANVGSSTIVNVTVNNAGDTTPPTAPSNLVATAAKRKITLAWTASTDNVGVTGYQIWRATSPAGTFAQIATTTSTTYADSLLKSGSTFYYYATATDAAGNLSAASSTASATAK